MGKLEASKIRDYGYRKRINALLEQAQAVHQKNRYLSYVHHRPLLEQIEQLYQENLHHYQNDFLANAERFQRIQAHYQAEKLHPIHQKQTQLMMQEIEHRLKLEDYQENARAATLLDALERYLKQSASALQKWRAAYESFQEKIEEIKPFIWLEIYEAYQAQLQALSKNLQGEGLPQEPILPPTSELEQHQQAKTQAIEAFREQIKSYPKLLHELGKFEMKPITQAAFEQFKTQTLVSILQQKRRKKTLIIALIIVIISALSFGGWMWYQKRELGVWKKAQQKGNYQSYLLQYPNGSYVEEARKLQEDQVWRQAYQALKAEDYLKQYPNGRYVAEAQALQTEAQQQLERQAWKDALQHANSTAYEAFLRAYPDGQYAQLANEALNPPTITWQKTYGGLQFENITDLISTQDGGYLFAGSNESEGIVKTDAWLVKLDANGVIEWEQTYWAGGQEDHALAVAKSSDGYVWGGYYEPKDKLLMSAILVSVDENGKKRWQKTWSEAGKHVKVFDVVLDDKGQIYAVGNVENGKETTAFVRKYDAKGRLLWEKPQSQGIRHAKWAKNSLLIGGASIVKQLDEKGEEIGRFEDDDLKTVEAIEWMDEKMMILSNGRIFILDQSLQPAAVYEAPNLWNVVPHRGHYAALSVRAGQNPQSSLMAVSREGEKVWEVSVPNAYLTNLIKTETAYLLGGSRRSSSADLDGLIVLIEP